MPTVSAQPQEVRQTAATDTTDAFAAPSLPPLPPTPYGIRGWRCLRLGLHFVWGGLLTATIYPWIDGAKRLRIKQRWSRRTLELLAIRIDAPPVAMPPGCLIVANHISWLDIFAINALRPAAFIAKSEVRRWPFIGWLSARNDTLFLHRDSRTHAREINREIAARLAHEADVAIFPEGTTSDGSLLHGFHAALLQPAIDAGRPLLPLALDYRDARGNFSPAPSYAGEITLMQCFSAILACRALTVRILPASPIFPTDQSRRALADAAHAAIAQQLDL